jgi:Asp-tRNA(Asn)/Glu-tRNA(Gln) amidotransferase A subunit family amidase
MVPESTRQGPGAELGWLSAREIAALVTAGEVTRQEVADAHLRRAQRYEGRVHAFLHLEPQLSEGSGPLAGVPVGVKDTQPVLGMRWTSGALKWRDRVAEVDAVPAARARRAGSTILGKTNTPELASNPSTVNELMPPTENPWRPGYTPGGSSGGSAAAVAAGLCTLAIGDDYGGSVRIPAACCGVFGLRPTPGDLPEEVPDVPHINSRGPMARSVVDLRLAFEVMAGVPAPRSERARLHVALVLRSSDGLHVDLAARQAAERAAHALEDLGHRVEEVDWAPLACLEAYRPVRRVSFGAIEGEPEEYSEFVALSMRQGREISGPEYFRAVQLGSAGARKLLQERLETNFDAFLTPVLGFLPMPIEQVPSFFGEQWNSQNQFLLPVSFSGLPALSIPAGLHDGVPVAVQLVGRHRREAELMDLAEQLEDCEGFGFRRPPGFD